MSDKKKGKRIWTNQYNYMYLLRFIEISPLFIEWTAVSTNVSNDNNDAAVTLSPTAVAAVFVGVLVVLINDDDDGTTTRGITAFTNDGRFEI